MQLSCRPERAISINAMLSNLGKLGFPFSVLLVSWPMKQAMYCMYNNQIDALFNLSLLSYHTSTCFGRISSPSSGGRMYICGKWYLLYF
jgi:hypothetical protein